MSKLSAKKEQFCKNYVESRNTRESALKAGYSKSYAETKAYKLLHDEGVRLRIEELESAYFSKFFKDVAVEATGELKKIINNPKIGSSTKLRAIELVMRQAGALDLEKETPQTVIITPLTKYTKSIDHHAA